MASNPQGDPWVFLVVRGNSFKQATKDYILRDGEIGFEKDTKRIKMGDGVTRWELLGYYPAKAEIVKMIADALADYNPGGGVGGSLTEHINSESPHPVYDNMPSLELLYDNAKT